MTEKQKKTEQTLFGPHDSEIWTPRMQIFGSGVTGILLIWLLASNIPDTAQDQFWNVTILGSVTWLLLVTAWVQKSVSHRQWLSMKDQESRMIEQREEMIEQRKIMTRQLKAADRQANSATAQSAMMREQLELMKGALAETRNSIKQNEQMIGVSMDQAELSRKSLDFTETSFLVAERAYLVVKSIKFEHEFQADVSPVISLVILNGGRTPAFEVRMYIHSCMTDQLYEHIPPSEWRHELRKDALPVVLSGEERNPLSDGHVAPTGDLLNRWLQGQVYYYVRVELRYFDVNGGERYDIYGFEYHPEFGFILCELDTNAFRHP